MVDVAVATTADLVIRYQQTGEVGDRRGNDGVYACAGNDRWIAIDVARDPLPSEARAEWCRERAPEVAERELLAAGIPALAVVPGFAALDDPQLQARGYFEPLTHAVVGEQQFPGWPMRLSGGPSRFWRRPAPCLGEHNDDVLGGELGLDGATLAGLRERGVIGEAPAPPEPPRA
jgi:crotonobetainyl-CoA:carnitine CoA-transferase CaiB-like acyl-CoA transferase